MVKTLDDWDGKSMNGYPYISADSGREIECCVETHQGVDDDGNAVYENNCGWSGPVSELDRGRPKIGSKPRALLCPQCSRRLAYEAGTATAGHWGRVLEGL